MGVLGMIVGTIITIVGEVISDMIAFPSRVWKVIFNLAIGIVGAIAGAVADNLPIGHRQTVLDERKRK